MGLYTSIIYSRNGVLTDEIIYSYMYEEKSFESFDLTGFGKLHSIIMDYAEKNNLEIVIIDDDGYITFSSLDTSKFVLFCTELIHSAMKEKDFYEVANIAESVCRFQEAIRPYHEFYIYNFG